MSKIHIVLPQILVLSHDQKQVMRLKDITKLNNELLECLMLEVFDLRPEAPLQIGFRRSTLEFYTTIVNGIEKDFYRAIKSVAQRDKKPVSIQLRKAEKRKEGIEKNVAQMDGPKRTEIVDVIEINIPCVIFEVGRMSSKSEKKPLAFLETVRNGLSAFCGKMEISIGKAMVLGRFQEAEKVEINYTLNQSVLVSSRLPSGRIFRDDDIDDFLEEKEEFEEFFFSPLYGLKLENGENGPRISVHKFVEMRFSKVGVDRPYEVILQAFSAESVKIEEFDFLEKLDFAQFSLNFELVSCSYDIEDWVCQLCPLDGNESPSLVYCYPNSLELQKVVVSIKNHEDGKLLGACITKLLGFGENSENEHKRPSGFKLACTDTYFDLKKLNFTEDNEMLFNQSLPDSYYERNEEQTPDNIHNRTVFHFKNYQETLTSNESKYAEWLLTLQEDFSTKPFESISSDSEFFLSNCDVLQIYTLYFGSVFYENLSQIAQNFIFVNIMKKAGKNLIKLSDYGLTEVAKLSGFKYIQAGLPSLHSQTEAPDTSLYFMNEIILSGTLDIIHFISRVIFPYDLLLQDSVIMDLRYKNRNRLPSEALQGEFQSQVQEPKAENSSFDDFEVCGETLFERNSAELPYSKSRTIFRANLVKLKLFPGRDFVAVDLDRSVKEKLENLYNEMTFSRQTMSLNFTDTITQSFKSSKKEKLLQVVSMFKNERIPTCVEVKIRGFTREGMISQKDPAEPKAYIDFDIQEINAECQDKCLVSLPQGIKIMTYQGRKSVKIEIELNEVFVSLNREQNEVLTSIIDTKFSRREGLGSDFNFTDGRMLAKLLLDWSFGTVEQNGKTTVELENSRSISFCYQDENGSKFTFKIPKLKLALRDKCRSLSDFFSDELVEIIKIENPKLAHLLFFSNIHPIANKAYYQFEKVKKVSSTKASQMIETFSSYFSKSPTGSKIMP